MINYVKTKKEVFRLPFLLLLNYELSTNNFNYCDLVIVGNNFYEV